jgi:hypothetical protein
MTEIVASVVAGLILYQGYVTLRVVRSASYDYAQKWRQALLIWFIPFIGAAIIHSVLATDNEIPVRPDKDFVPQDPNDRG